MGSPLGAIIVVFPPSWQPGYQGINRHRQSCPHRFIMKDTGTQ
jgi:hypothetical protein